MIWTPELVADLKARAARDLSASAIGKEMGLSKFAIIGAAHRYQVSLGKQPYWSEERLDQLRQFVAAKLSAADMCGKLGVSRAAVIAAARRHGITLAWKPGSHGGKNVKPRGPAKPKLRLITKSVASAEPTPLRLTFEQLEWGQCRYAVNDELPFMFCGRPVAQPHELPPLRNGEPRQDCSPYCSFHHKLTHTDTRETVEENAKRRRAYQAERRARVMEAAE